jgi:ABC-2 type transport system ATP-binding protein
VVAQRAVQNFLRHYQQLRRITILLTSHYMKDVAALCRRTVIISGGRIIYDGSLSGIVDQFSNHKVVTLTFADGQMMDQPERLGQILEQTPPKLRLRVERAELTRGLAEVLTTYAIEDVSVEDPPLEEVIAEVFALHHADGAAIEASAR